MESIFLQNIQIITSISYVVVGINFILAAIVFSRGVKNLVNVLFGVIALFLALWAIAVVGFFSSDFLPEVDWVVWTHIFAILVSLFFLYFSIVYPNVVLKKVKLWFTLLLVPVLFVIYLVATGRVVGKTEGYVYELLPGYLVYSAVIMLYFFATYGFLIYQYRRTSDINTKNQLRYIFFGYTLGSLLASFTELTLPFLGVYEYTWLGPLFTLLVVGSIFVSILRYGLFDIKVIIAEIFSILTIFALLFDILLSDTTSEVIAKTIILILVALFVFQFIKSVYREVRQREELAEANKQLARLNLEKSEFLSLASHQLKSPLAVMRGYTSMLLEGSYGEIQPKGKEVLERIYASVHNLVVIIDDFLNVSRIDQGRMKYDFGIVDVRKLVSDVAEELKHTAQSEEIDLEAEIKVGGPVQITADYGKLRQMITNITDNALKYTKKGIVRIILECNSTTKKVTIRVKDNGMGMSKETISRLFKRFSRAKDVGKSQVGGSGLGLYIVREMVLAHGGKIWAESEGDGKGSEFIVELPFMPPNTNPLRERKTEENGRSA